MTRALGQHVESGDRILAEVAIDAPLRLDVAAKLAFPDGSMGAAGLRKERDAGRLATEMIAGKEYVTLAEIAAMRVKCRGLRKAPASSGETKAGKLTAHSATKPAGSSATGNPSLALAAALAAVNALKKRSPNTSPRNTAQPASADVIPIK